MSGGTVVRSTGMTSVFFNAGPFPLRGMSSMYCSPTAFVLCTCTATSAGIFRSESSASTAFTPVGVKSMSCTRPTSVPRYVTLAFLYRPAATGGIHRYSVFANTEEPAGHVQYKRGHDRP